MSEEAWGESIDGLLTGVWKVCKAFIPKILEGEAGGAIVLTSSTRGLLGAPIRHWLCACQARRYRDHAHPGVGARRVRPAGERRLPRQHADRDDHRGGTIERSIEFRPRFVGSIETSSPKNGKSRQ
jgi:NAD(P)-dependent dehydrogenase (short-subunit alcohol dehydrogenase family)